MLYPSTSLANAEHSPTANATTHAKKRVTADKNMRCNVNLLKQPKNKLCV